MAEVDLIQGARRDHVDGSHAGQCGVYVPEVDADQVVAQQRVVGHSKSDAEPVEQGPLHEGRAVAGQQWVPSRCRTDLLAGFVGLAPNPVDGLRMRLRHRRVDGGAGARHQIVEVVGVTLIPILIVPLRCQHIGSKPDCPATVGGLHLEKEVDLRR